MSLKRPDQNTIGQYAAAEARHGRKARKPLVAMKGESVIREQADRARGPPLTPQDLAALPGRAGVTRLRQLAQTDGTVGLMGWGHRPARCAHRLRPSVHEMLDVDGDADMAAARRQIPE
jgi:hypothetical protein